MPASRCAHDVERVLGGEEQDAPAPDDGEAAQARRPRRDGDGHVEREKRLAALRLAADDADGLVGPQPLDEPALLLGAGVELVGAADGQRGHRPLRSAVRRGAWAVAGRAKTSR